MDSKKRDVLPRQDGKGGLTTILDIDTYKQSTDRPMAVDRMDVSVGERPIRGIPYLRNKDMVPMDVKTMLSRDRIISKGRQDTARLGQSLPSLPDRREAMRNAGVPQIGGNFKKTVKKIGETVGKAVKTAKETKIISKLADIGAKGALFLGQPEIAAPLQAVSVGAKTLGFGLESKTAIDEVMDDARGVSGFDKQSFVATHPLNYHKATLSSL